MYFLRFDAGQETLQSLLKEQVKKNQRKTRPKVPLFPIVAERKYRRELRNMVRYTKMLITTRLLPKITDMKAQAVAVKQDSFVDDMNQVIEGIKFSVFSKYPANRRQQMAMESATDVNRTNKTQFNEKVLVANSLPIPATEPWIEPYLESYTYVNSRLIESIPEKYLDNVQGIVNEGVLKGYPTSQIRSEIQEQFGVSDRRAQLIARDQVSKLNGQLNRTRQEKAGFNKYIWQTVGDDSVRGTHAAHQGKTYSWDNPPSDTGHPGEDYNCRCWPEPVFDEDVEAQMEE